MIPDVFMKGKQSISMKIHENLINIYEKATQLLAGSFRTLKIDPPLFSEIRHVIFGRCGEGGFGGKNERIYCRKTYIG